jgi:hypothetical protein
VFTDWSLDMLDWVQELRDDGTIQYIRYAQEIGEKDGQPHLQGHFCLKKQMRFNALKKRLSDAGGDEVHFSVMRGSYEQNEEYEDKGGGPIFEDGVKPKNGRPKRKATEIYLELLNEGKSVYEIVNEHSGALFHMRALQEYQRIKRARTIPAWREMKVIVLYGPTGTGKTRMGMSCPEKTFLMNPAKNEWWDGYQGEEVCVLDEYVEQWPITRLLKILDGYPIQLPVKGGFESAAFTTVILTSNVPPDSWYIGWAEASRAALSRRITAVYNVEMCCTLNSDSAPVKLAWAGKDLQASYVYENSCRAHPSGPDPMGPPPPPPTPAECHCGDEDCDKCGGQ